eukprot:jgi/Ulvmu1/1208/UM109_0006.1
MHAVNTSVNLARAHAAKRAIPYNTLQCTVSVHPHNGRQHLQRTCHIPPYSRNPSPTTMPTKSLKTGSVAKAAPAKPAPKAKSSAPKILTRIEKLKLLSKLEEAGLLSTLEKNGITLEFIEENKLLSKAESAGAISLLTDRGTPGALSTLGFVLLGLAAAAVFVIPDDGAGLIIAQSALAGALGGAGVAALAGGNLIASLQKD